FQAAGLPEYNGCYALVLDSLFSTEELSSFLAEAEVSSPWKVAQINAGTHEYTDTSYRNSDRIIYDSFELLDKIFVRIRPHLKEIEEFDGEAKQKWRMVRKNERLRSLRYPIGGYFKDHQDGKTKQRTFYTLQFYLPSDRQIRPDPRRGGTTRFLSWSSRPRHAHADLEAVPGWVLVFQHAKHLHTGAEVIGGVKCTMRSDMLYERVGLPVLVYSVPVRP
ncbi:hypothetical protein B0H16DRAFT_1332662, partial [Mycena metata]